MTRMKTEIYYKIFESISWEILKILDEEGKIINKPPKKENSFFFSKK